MKKISILFLLLSLSVLVSCNSGGSSSPTSVPVNPTSDLSGTVSSVLNFMNPISSAHAASEICTTPNGSNKGVQIYLVDKDGTKNLICYTNLNSDGSFNTKIKKTLIPGGYQLKIEAMVGGALREAILNLDSTKDVSVDSASTLAFPVIHDQWTKGNDFDAKAIRTKVKEFVLKSVGVEASDMKPEKIAMLQYTIANSKDSFEKTLFNPGADIGLDDSFKAFLGKVYSSSPRLGADGYYNPGALLYTGENVKTLDESLNQFAKKVQTK